MIEVLFTEMSVKTNRLSTACRAALTSTEQLVENTITQDVFLTVGLLPADFEGGGTESRKDQSAGGVWNPRGEPCI